MAKLIHEIVMSGALAHDPQSGFIRFFDKKRLKEKGEFIGPLAFHPRSIQEPFLNLLMFAPLLYQTTQRAKMDAQDIIDKLGHVIARNVLPREAGLEILAQLEMLKAAIEIVQKAARDGIET